MKKMLALILIVFLAVSIGIEAKKDKTLNTFMGVTWGESISQFLKKIQSDPPPTRLSDTAYQLKDYQLNGAKVEITFIFAVPQTTNAVDGSGAAAGGSADAILSTVSVKFLYGDFSRINQYFKKIYGKPSEHKISFLKFQVKLHTQSSGGKPRISVTRTVWKNSTTSRQVDILNPEAMANKIHVQGGTVTQLLPAEIKYGMVYLKPLTQ